MYALHIEVNHNYQNNVTQKIIPCIQYTWVITHVKEPYMLSAI